MLKKRFDPVIGAYHANTASGSKPDFFMRKSGAHKLKKAGKGWFVECGQIFRMAPDTMVDEHIKSAGETPASITMREVELNGLGIIEPLSPAVRRVRAKIKIWPWVGDQKAIRVRPNC